MNRVEDFAERERKNQFQNFLSEMNPVYIRLLMASNFLWFSRGLILYRLECLDEILIFMTNERF